MKRLVWALFVLSACGGGKSYCEKSQDWVSDCGTAAVEPSEEEMASCEEALAPCSNADQKHLVDGMECMLDLGVFNFCDTADATAPTSTEDLMALATAMLECQAEFDAVSAECAAAANVDFSTGSMTTPMYGSSTN